MIEAIYFPDAVTVACSAIGAGLPSGVSAFGRIPKTRPARFVRVLRLGGTRRDRFVDNATLSIEAWAGTDQSSAELAALARAALNACEGAVIDGATIYTITELSGPANLPDPLSDQSRHTWTVQVAIRGTTDLPGDSA